MGEVAVILSGRMSYWGPRGADLRVAMPERPPSALPPLGHAFLMVIGWTIVRNMYKVIDLTIERNMYKMKTVFVEEGLRGGGFDIEMGGKGSAGWGGGDR